MKKLITSILVILLTSSIIQAAEPLKVDPRKQEKNYISVDFEDAQLQEIVFMISEYTGAAFVFTGTVNKPVSWTQKDIYKDDIVGTFQNVVSSLGYTCQLVKGSNNFYVIKGDSQITDSVEQNSIGVYHLKNLTAESLKDSAEILYGTKLSLSFHEDNHSVAYSGSSSIVQDFTKLLQRIDKPLETDLLSIRLQNISVRAALKAVSDLKILERENYYPDYWNRSLVVRGTEHQLNIVRAAIESIDKPQSGWVDEIFIVQTEIEQLSDIISSVHGDIQVRPISPNRIFMSGPAEQVEKASVLLNKIDGAGLQVKVEAVIAYLTDREFHELGVKLSYKDKEFKGAINNNLIDTLITKNTGLLLDYFSDMIGLTFAAEDGVARGEILSSPMLTVLNGKSARIHVGQNVPYISKANFNKNDGEDTETSIERKDVGITFSVTPTIEPDGDFIYLKVDQIVSNVLGDSELSQDAVDIIIDKKEISSTVMVGNGDTIFLGGLRSEESGSATDKVPFLGELPIIGQLFTYDAKQTEKRHLIVSLRVNVIGKNV